ncbi:MAG: phosphatidylinositol-specific phospholipase C/glycerophosphodiester phosphodiesterase family protein [Sedimentisphaerales bacterium]|nr:phosphatidylinositol-specific phospholipase C/glycerophosphodiester phosphodiesterase family protein [Sedimentisphaerales bacterium]
MTGNRWQSSGFVVFVFVCLVSPSLLCGRAFASDTEIVPLSHAHAHNDYRHERPLLDALAHGFCSVEADIFLVEGELFVAHDREEIRPERTLRSLYLDPLRERIKKNGGRVYPNGPEFILLIDIKTEAVSTYKALDNMLAEYRDILTSFERDGRKSRAVLAIISGNRPFVFMKSQDVRYAAHDGRLTDLESDAPADLIPMISDHWGRHFTWRGDGPMPAEERIKLKAIVQTAHKKGRRVRFWATPDQPSPAREALWRELLSAHVDLLNTDDLKGLQQFLLSRRSK